MSKVFFPVLAGTTQQLFSIDRTVNGTGLVQGGVLGPFSALGKGDQLYFAGNDGTHGYELWTTDGTTTSMMLDINPIDD